jgi:hypothetical protein
MTTKNGCRFKRNKGSERYTKDWFVINLFIDRTRTYNKFVITTNNDDDAITIKMATQVISTYTWHHLHESRKIEIAKEVRNNVKYITLSKILVAILLEGDSNA